MQENVQVYEEDIIDLRELLKALKKRKNIIAGITGIITLLAIFYVFLAQPIYEVKSNVMIGYMGLDKEKKRIDIADPAVIAKRLNVVFNVEDEVKVENFISKVSSVEVNKKLENFITIRTEAISNEEALKKNKEVVKYTQDMYQSKIDRYIVNNNNAIKAKEIEIKKLEELETKNIKNQIEKLKIQSIVKINEEIAFYKHVKLKTLEDKISLHVEKLKEYTKSVKDIYINSKNSDKTTVAISSMQIVNYQNLILNSQNRIEDLKVEIELVKNQTIPNLKRDKNNLQNDTLRKLKYTLNVELAYKKVKLLEEIEQLKYNKSEQNIQNSKVIGEFVIKDRPLKPKKALVVVVAFITGLMLSIFLAFFMEFIRNTKRREDV